MDDVRPIDANALKDQAVEVDIVTPPHNHCCSELVVFDYDIDEAPTIDAVPVVHGQWLRENIRPKSYLRACSMCKKTAYFCGEGCSYKYCPNCGAKMDAKDMDVPTKDGGTDNV